MSEDQTAASAPEVTPPEPPSAEEHSVRRPLLVLVGLLVLAAVCWFVIGRMMDDSSIQDCVQSGRTNCAPVGGVGR